MLAALVTGADSRISIRITCLFLLTVLGVTVQTNGATVFKDSNEVAFATEDDFWAAVSDGSLINIDGTETGPQTLLADEVELELE